MRGRPPIDWSAAGLVIVAVALAMVGAFAFGSRYNQVQAILVALIFLLGLAGVYSLSKR
jgi:hypothetical protein